MSTISLSTAEAETYDWPTLIVAIIAVVISLYSIFLQVRKKPRLIVRLIDTGFDPNKEDDLIYTYFIGNTGNVEYYLKDVGLSRYDKTPKSNTDISAEATNVPLIVQTNKSHIVEVVYKKSDYDLSKTNDGLYVFFNFLSPSGDALSYFHEIKGIHEAEDYLSFMKSICLQELNEESEPHKVRKA